MGDEVTLYDRIGGEATISRVIDDFYRRVLADPALEPFFRYVSIDKLRRMQREFLGAALDGPQRYSGLSLAHVHSGRGITVDHFNRFTQHLLETLRSAGVDKHDVDAVIARINTYVDDIIGGSGRQRVGRPHLLAGDDRHGFCFDPHSSIRRARLSVSLGRGRFATCALNG